jgi:hypothetical protein
MIVQGAQERMFCPVAPVLKVPLDGWRLLRCR